MRVMHARAGPARCGCRVSEWLLARCTPSPEGSPRTVSVSRLTFITSSLHATLPSHTYDFAPCGQDYVTFASRRSA